MLAIGILVLAICVVTFAVAVTSLTLSSLDYTNPSSIKKLNGFGASTGPTLTIALDPLLVGLLKGNGAGVELASAEDVTSAKLTGLEIVAGDVSSADTILSGMGKLDANITLISDNVLEAKLAGFAPAVGTVTSADSVISALEKIDANTPSIVTANGFAGSAGPLIAISLSPPITGLLKGNGTGIVAASSTDVTDAKMTNYVSGPGVIGPSDTVLTSIEKLNGNVVAPVLQQVTVTPVDAVTPLVLDPNKDVIIIDTSNSSALCTLDVPSFDHILTIQIKFQFGMSAIIEFVSGGCFVIDATVPLVQLFYHSGWRILTTSTDLNSFIPNASSSSQKIIGLGTSGAAAFGSALFFSADGTTLAIGGLNDSSNAGALWIYTLVSNVWTFQQKLSGSGPVGANVRQTVIGLSADGNTVAIGGQGDNGNKGAVWIFTRSAGVWTQQGAKIVPFDVVGSTVFVGRTGGLSADGNILIFGGRADSGGTGAIWVYKRSSGVWVYFQKIPGTSTIGFGASCAISADGSILAGGNQTFLTTAVDTLTLDASGNYVRINSNIVPPGIPAGVFENLGLSTNGRTLAYGDNEDGTNVGSTTVFTLANSVWTQQSINLVGTGAVGTSGQGDSVCFSGDGNVMAVGGSGDNSLAGAVWLFRRTGTNWEQFGSKIVGPGATGNARQGFAVAMSSDGHALAIGATADNSGVGAVWVYWK